MVDILHVDAAGEQQADAQLEDVRHQEQIEGAEKAALEPDPRRQQGRPPGGHDTAQEQHERERQPRVELEGIAEADEQRIQEQHAPQDAAHRLLQPMMDGARNE